MTQDRIVATILFVVFLIIAYKLYKMIMKRTPMGGSTSCSSGACGTCAFNSGNSCEDKTYARKEGIKVKKLKI